MKITYRREMKHNYLIIDPDETGYDSFEMHMLAANGIDGLMKFHVKHVDNQKSYYYEITSKQPLNRVLEYHSLGEEELKKLIGGIAQTLGRLEVYLLKENQILLEPEYIYVEPERFSIYLCLVPGRQGSFPEEMTGLLRYLLGKVNHQDKECVVMAYGLYQESLKENYGMNDLLEIIGKRTTNMEKDHPVELDQAKEKIKQEDSELPLLDSFKEESRKKDVLPGDAKPDKESFDLVKAGIFAFLAMAGIAAALWFSFGVEGIFRFWFAPPAAGVLTAAAVFIGYNKKNQSQKEEVPKKEEVGSRLEERYDWQMAFEEETEEKEKKQEPQPETEADIMQTVLLTDTSADKNIRYLRAVRSEIPDISITYVPYLIGKQEGLVDYVIESETISRIHARIDRVGEEYRLSDLNSTNGTSVNGRILETNETVDLKKGDEVFIANFAFIFT